MQVGTSSTYGRSAHTPKRTYQHAKTSRDLAAERAYSALPAQCHDITGRDASTRCATHRWTVRPGTSASRDRHVAVRADSTRASCIDGGGSVASCTAPNNYLLPDNYLLPAGGSYFLGRGIYAGSGRVSRSRHRRLAQ